MNTASVMIVGAREDPHVQAVLSLLAEHETLILDAESLSRLEYVADDSGLQVRAADSEKWVALSEGARGWFRRFAPRDWHLGVVSGSLDAVIKTSWASLLGGVIRSAREVTWITEPEVAIAAENKLLQMTTARSAAIPMPRTVITSRIEVVSARIGPEAVLKPLGPSDYAGSSGETRASFAQTLRLDDVSAAELSGAPFIAQQPLQARRHLRIVTVGTKAWVAALEAHDLPLDWRLSDAAHRSFRAVQQAEVASKALLLASAMGVGYSSQDWIETVEDLYFLDLNPGGQWLFLPEPIASEVSRALATALTTVPVR